MHPFEFARSHEGYRCTSHHSKVLDLFAHMCGAEIYRVHLFVRVAVASVQLLKSEGEEISQPTNYQLFLPHDVITLTVLNAYLYEGQSSA